MIIVSAILVFAANGFILFLVYRNLKRHMERNSAADDLLTQIRDEIGHIMTELNQVTDRNVGIVEGKMAELSRLLDDTDRKILLLSREKEKLDAGKRYSQLKPPVLILPEDNTEKGNNRENGPELPGLSVLPPDAGLKNTAPVNMAQEERPETPASTETRTSREPGESREPQGFREEAIAMHRQGIDRRLIAKKLQKTIGEIDLIISLEERKG